MTSSPAFPTPGAQEGRARPGSSGVTRRWRMAEGFRQAFQALLAARDGKPGGGAPDEAGRAAAPGKERGASPPPRTGSGAEAAARDPAVMLEEVVKETDEHPAGAAPRREASMGDAFGSGKLSEGKPEGARRKKGSKGPDDGKGLAQQAGFAPGWVLRRPLAQGEIPVAARAGENRVRAVLSEGRKRSGGAPAMDAGGREDGGTVRLMAEDGAEGKLARAEETGPRREETPGHGKMGEPARGAPLRRGRSELAHHITAHHAAARRGMKAALADAGAPAMADDGMRMTPVARRRFLPPAGVAAGAVADKGGKRVAEQVLRPLRTLLTRGMGQKAAGGGKVVRDIEIQLHPASLGTVAARLVQSGDRLEVTLTVAEGRAADQVREDLADLTRRIRARVHGVEHVRMHVLIDPATGSAARPQPLHQDQAGAAGNDGGRGGLPHGGAAGDERQAANRERHDETDMARGGEEPSPSLETDSRSGAAGSIYL